jgi:hypothetical protein
MLRTLQAADIAGADPDALSTPEIPAENSVHSLLLLQTQALTKSPKNTHANFIPE